MRSLSRIAVFGAGNGGYALASDLALAGFEVNLFELEKFKAQNLTPIQEKEGIEREGVRPGFARISMLTSDVEDAVKDVEVINITVPAFAHMTFIKMISPYLNGKIVVFFPLNFADLKLRCYLKQKGMKKDVVVGGGETMPYACRRMKPAHVFVRASTAGARVAASPVGGMNRLVDALKQYPFPIIQANNTLEVSLGYDNPLDHIPIMLLNAGSIERTKGEYQIFSHVIQGKPPSQKKLEDKLNEERSAICRRLGVDDLLAHGHTLMQGAKAAVPDPRAYFSMTETLNYRYLTEDIPYGLVTWSSLGDLIGVPTPTMKACIHIASILLDTDYWKEGTTADKLGLSGLSAKSIIEQFE